MKKQELKSIRDRVKKTEKVEERGTINLSFKDIV
jgi:hypothetical protein